MCHNVSRLYHAGDRSVAPARPTRRREGQPGRVSQSVFLVFCRVVSLHSALLCVHYIVIGGPTRSRYNVSALLPHGMSQLQTFELIPMFQFFRRALTQRRRNARLRHYYGAPTGEWAVYGGHRLT